MAPFQTYTKGGKIPQSLCGPAPKQERTETSNRRRFQTPLASGRYQGRQSHAGRLGRPPFLGLSETARTFPSTEKYQGVPPPPLTSARPEPELWPRAAVTSSPLPPLYWRPCEAPQSTTTGGWRPTPSVEPASHSAPPHPAVTRSPGAQAQVQARACAHVSKRWLQILELNPSLPLLLAASGETC